MKIQANLWKFLNFNLAIFQSQHFKMAIYQQFPGLRSYFPYENVY